jgi:threonine dehydratase
MPVDLAAIRVARQRISPYVHRTPVMRSSTFDRETGVHCLFKCENLQKVGAFKARGACNAVQALSDADAKLGVLTHSSGNHGAALAWAAAIRGVPSLVVMPDDAPRIKVVAVRGYGAEVVLCPRPERDAVSVRLVKERGMTFVHPFENEDVIAGQGTAALELVEDVPGLDALIAPVGGGGLLSGTAVVARALVPGALVLGAEPELADDAARSLATGVRQPAVGKPSLADGLLTALGPTTFAILTAERVGIVTVAEAAIADAARFLLERMKIVVEPSGAIVLAAIRKLAGDLRGKRVGAILSGGNTDFCWLR